MDTRKSVHCNWDSEAAYLSCVNRHGLYIGEASLEVLYRHHHYEYFRKPLVALISLACEQAWIVYWRSLEGLQHHHYYELKMSANS